nr:pentatricopeptide repeat-containing protein At2g13600-like [Ipomoea batatas]
MLHSQLGKRTVFRSPHLYGTSASFQFHGSKGFIASSIPPKRTANFSSTTWYADKEGEEAAYACALRKCVETSNLGYAKAIHAKLFRTPRMAFSLYLHNHVLNAYVKCGDIGGGLKLFDDMPEKNIVSWTALIAGFVQKGFPVEAFSSFFRMHSSGIKPNEFTFVSALHACSFADSLSLLHLCQVYGLIVKFGFESNIYLVNAFLTGLLRHHRLEEAKEVFENCSNKDNVTWNAMLDGYVQLCCSELPRFWLRMIRNGVGPDKFTFSSVLTGLAEHPNLEMGVQVHAWLIKCGHGSEVCVGNSLVDMYLKSQRLSEGLKAFEEIHLKDVRSWTQMAAGLLNYEKPSWALQVVGKMRMVGVRPNKFTLATAFNACANLADLKEGEKLHGLRIKLEYDIDVCVDNALLDMYAKCGCMDGAFMVFKSMNERTIVSWTAMIAGYAQNGCPKEALEIFHEMRSRGVEPNVITLICVLYACSQGGLIDEGWSIFSSMSREYGIVPIQDHYACMVNLLGRAGRIKEAEELILGMPYQPGLLVWQTLLGACVLHGDTETAKRAAEKALNINKNDPATYVLLSNTFASLHHWENVGNLREIMESRDVKKVPGSSWLEINRGKSLLEALGEYA